ncbi:MAG: GntR family transcriptional regulator [Longicatena sp.]
MNYTNTTPIYVQIMDDIKEKIILGEYTPNMQIPPVRELAITYEVNPNTMQRALAELEREGYLYTMRTAGRFVIDDPVRIQEMKQELLHHKTDAFIKDISVFAMSDEELINKIKERMKAYAKHKKR